MNACMGNAVFFFLSKSMVFPLFTDCPSQPLCPSLPSSGVPLHMALQSVSFPKPDLTHCSALARNCPYICPSSDVYLCTELWIVCLLTEHQHFGLSVFAARI